MAKQTSENSAKRREYADGAVVRQKRPIKRQPSPRAQSKVGSVDRVKDGEAAGATGKAEQRLSPQERFCRLIAIDEKLPLEAYVEAFGWKGAPADARKSAYSLLAIPEIEERIAQLRPPLLEGVEPEDMLSLEQHLKELYILERAAMAAGQFGAAIQAAVYRGKASGLYIERVAVAHMTLEDLIARSREDGKIGIQGTEIKPKHASGRPLLSGPRVRSAR